MGRDQQFLQVELAKQDGLALAPAALEAGAVVHALLHPRDVATGAKRAAGTGEQGDVAARIALGISQDLSQLGVQPGVDGVARCRALETDDQHPGWAGDADGLVVGKCGHGRSRMQTRIVGADLVSAASCLAQ